MSVPFFCYFQPTLFDKFYILIFTIGLYFPFMFALEICDVQFSITHIKSDHGVCVQVNFITCFE